MQPGEYGKAAGSCSRNIPQSWRRSDRTREELEELRKHLDEKLDGSDENVHKECVKVYRNVQAAVVEENEKQTEAIAGKIKESLNGK